MATWQRASYNVSFFFFFFQSRSEEGEAGWVVRTPYHNPPAQKRTWSGWKKKEGATIIFFLRALKCHLKLPHSNSKTTLSSFPLLGWKTKKQKRKEESADNPTQEADSPASLLACRVKGVCAPWGECVCVCGCVSLCCRIAARRLSLRLCLLQSESRAAACLRWRSHWVLKPTSPRTRPLW